jgi:hypothetical protein
LGIIWGYRYFKQKQPKYKLAGLAAIAGTIILLGIITKKTIDTINTVNDQVNNQLENLMMY